MIYFSVRTNILNSIMCPIISRNKRQRKRRVLDCQDLNPRRLRWCLTPLHSELADALSVGAKFPHQYKQETSCHHLGLQCQQAAASNYSLLQRGFVSDNKANQWCTTRQVFPEAAPSFYFIFSKDSLHYI